MIPSICSTDTWWVFPSLPGSSKCISANSTGSNYVPRERLKIESQLANVIGKLFDGVNAGSCSGWSVGTWVSRVSDVGCICGNCASASCFRYYT